MNGFVEWLTEKSGLGFISSQGHCQIYHCQKASTHHLDVHTMKLRRAWAQILLNEAMQ